MQRTGDSKAIEKAKTELNKARKELSAFKTETMQINDILNNLSSASISQLNKASKSLNAQMKSTCSQGTGQGCRRDGKDCGVGGYCSNGDSGHHCR